MINENEIQKIKQLNNIHTTWRDYCLIMLNSTAEPLRSIWREKIITSIIHSSFNFAIVSENSLAGLEILSSLPDWFTEMIVDDSFNFNSWFKNSRIPGSKKMKIKLGHYPQESLSNEANLCIKYIIKYWEKCNYLIFDNYILKKVWDFSQISKGNCLYPDEVLTYTLEKNLDLNKNCNWIDACIDIYTNGIPSKKFKKYYFANKLDGFPFEISKNIEDKKYYFLNVCNKILKEDITAHPSWKRICICILKNDVSMRYAGFGLTLRERKAREESLKAFNQITNSLY